MNSNTIGKMKDIHHPVLDNVSIFKVHQSKKESFLYSVLAALYSNNIDRRTFHNPNAYKKYRKLLNLTNIPFPMKNKHIFYIFKTTPGLISLLDYLTLSQYQVVK